ncbi:hypothetical protein AX16_004274 [Volvariella volvacea WC 439]|nr:hypothetical protein AX16_004274 [Volvariella volvacea WC 439]
MDDTELDDGGPRHATGVRKAVLTSPTAVVHVYYDIDNPPPKPSSTLQSDTKTSESSSSASEPPESTTQVEEHWTRFVCLSDTHNHEFPVPDGDVLLHGGDLTNTGELREFERTVEWLRGLPHKKKIIIGGNHDLTLDKDWYERKWERFHCSRGKQDRDVIMELLRGPEAIEAGLVYLQDEEHKFQVREGGRMWSVYGSPWSPEFFDWAFNYFRSEGAALVGKFPKADIILTHGPAYGIFDQTRSEDEVGCEDLRRRLLELRPRLHVSGHIHEARGAHIHTWGQGPRVNQGDGDGLGPEVDGLPWVQYDALFGKGSETIEADDSQPHKHALEWFSITNTSSDTAREYAKPKCACAPLWILIFFHGQLNILDSTVLAIRILQFEDRCCGIARDLVVKNTERSPSSTPAKYRSKHLHLYHKQLCGREESNREYEQEMGARRRLTSISFLAVAGVVGPRALAQDTPAALISDPSSLVTPFIGTTNGGHVFPGATIPHGMIKVGMDTDSPGNHAGYDGDPKYNVTGFSQLHDSGTGGAVPLSNFKIFPFLECSSFEKCQTSLASRKVLRKILPNGSPDDFASPGYFATNLTNGIRVELTATRRAALHRYTFPVGTAHPRIAVDLTNDGQRSSTEPVMTLDPKTARVVGGASFAASFGPGRYRAFVCADFKGEGFDLGSPTEYGAFLANFPVQGTTNINQLYYSFIDELGALFTWKPSPQRTPTSILVRVGVSFISSDQACKNAETEIADWSFDRVHRESRKAWNDVLGRVQVDTRGVDPETVRLLYSSIYRTHISPADYSGENPKGNSTEPYFDSFYCNWDTYRTLYPLMSLHDPFTFANIVRGMIDIQKHEGWLPECRGATAQHYIQGGSNGDPIVSEYFVKYHQLAASMHVSADDLYAALLADAENQPPNWDVQGRQATMWKRLGYIPHDMFSAGGANTKQVSRTLEHAFNDFTIAQVAKILGKTDDARKYAQRGGNFINVWNPNVMMPDRPDIVGMMQPRFMDGTFNFTDPRHCSTHDPAQATCFLNAANRDGFYEGSPIIYSQYVPHDTAKLIELQGGPEKFVQRLDFIFEGDYFESTNEPSQQIPFMYHYVNRPGLSTQRSRQTIAQFFNTSTNGLPGNDGAMASYVAFYLAGLYPLPATRQFLLSSPYFPSISFFNPAFNSTTKIIAQGFSGNPADGTGGRVFVSGVKVNGRPYKSNCYLDWDVFEQGSTVELALSDDVSVTCGQGKDALPPSLSTGGYD